MSEENRNGAGYTPEQPTEQPRENTTEKRKLNEWPSKEEMNRNRTEFLKKWTPQDIEFLGNHSEYFGEHSPEVTERAAELINRYRFGILQSLHRFGDYPTNIPIAFIPENIEGTTGNEASFAYAVDEDVFVITLKDFASLMNSLEKTREEHGTITLDMQEIGKYCTPEEMFEITGVEEGAHQLYWRYGTHTIDTENDTFAHLGRDFIDPEKRAMLWKAAYTKRYFPHLLDDYSNKIKSDREIRSALRKQRKEDKIVANAVEKEEGEVVM